MQSILQALASAGLELVATALLAGGGVVLHRVYRWLGVSQDAQVRAYLDQALVNGIAWAQRRAADRLGIPPVGTGEAERLVTAVAEYVQGRVPDAVAHFGIDEPGLRRMIEARLARAPAPRLPQVPA